MTSSMRLFPLPLREGSPKYSERVMTIRSCSWHSCLGCLIESSLNETFATNCSSPTYYRSIILSLNVNGWKALRRTSWLIHLMCIFKKSQAS